MSPLQQHEQPGTNIRTGTIEDVPFLADLAAKTFPLSCPPGSDPADVRAHVRAHFGAPQFTRWIADTTSQLLVAETNATGTPNALVGFAVTVHHPQPPAELREMIEPDTRVELSKLYVASDAHGTGVADRLITRALTTAKNEHPDTSIFLSTGSSNRRAQTFYRRHGFIVVGQHPFVLGADTQTDVIMQHLRNR